MKTKMNVFSNSLGTTEPLQFHFFPLTQPQVINLHAVFHSLTLSVCGAGEVQCRSWGLTSCALELIISVWMLLFFFFLTFICDAAKCFYKPETKSTGTECRIQCPSVSIPTEYCWFLHLLLIINDSLGSGWCMCGCKNGCRINSRL